MILLPIPIHKLSKERANPKKKASLGSILLELSKSKELDLLKITKNPRTIKMIDPRKLLIPEGRILSKKSPKIKEKEVTIIDIAKSISLLIGDNFVFFNPFVMPIPKESILLEIAKIKTLVNIFSNTS